MSLLSGNNGSCSLTQVISDVTEGIVWMVTILVSENSSELGGAWWDISDDIDCKGEECTWEDIVDWCCLLMSSNYIQKYWHHHCLSSSNIDNIIR